MLFDDQGVLPPLSVEDVSELVIHAASALRSPGIYHVTEVIGHAPPATVGIRG